MNNIETLKSLTQTTFDSLEGYRKAIETAESPELKRALRRRADQRTQTLNTLNIELGTRGEKQITEVSTSGSGHQLWMKLTSAFMNGDKNAVSRIEEGEDYLAEQFRDALNDSDLDVATRTVIENAYNEIRTGEKFSDMLEEQYA